jgi:hypothetical protein
MERWLVTRWMSTSGTFFCAADDEAGAQAVCGEVSDEPGARRGALHDARDVAPVDAIVPEPFVAITAAARQREGQEHGPARDGRRPEPRLYRMYWTELRVAADERDSDLAPFSRLIGLRFSHGHDQTAALEAADRRHRARRARSRGSRRRTQGVESRDHVGRVASPSVSNTAGSRSALRALFIFCAEPSVLAMPVRTSRTILCAAGDSKPRS